MARGQEKQKTGNYQGKKVEEYYKLVKGGDKKENPDVDANVFKYLKEIMPDNFSDKIVVDLGAGDGRWSKYFVAHGARKVYAIEKSKDMIKLIEPDDQEKILPIQADMLQLPLKDNSVDVGFSSFSMMYFNKNNLDKIIVEVGRVLKNGGIFYIATNIIDIVNQNLKNKLEWNIVPIQLGVGKNKISLENIIQPIEAYRQSFQKTGLKTIEEKHFSPDGVGVSEKYKYKRDIKLEKVVFVLEKKQDLRPEWMKQNEVDKGEIILAGETYKYTVLKKELEPALAGFIGQFEGHFFISEEVPNEYRELQLIHEIIEFTELTDQPGRCLQALKRELELIPDNIKSEYLKYRKDFFKRLITYHTERDTNQEFIKEIRASYKLLVTLIK
jgi:ubiquinone/menaquinone biosynthesis C-methylase UbiE